MAPLSPHPDRAGTPGDRTGDPAASMSLLTHLLANPLDAGYGYYADADRTTRTRGLQRVLVLLLALALGAASVVAVRSLRHPGDNPVAEQLLDQAQSRQASVNAMGAQVEDLGRAIAAETGQSGATRATADPGLALSASTSGVTGAGLAVTLSDAADAAALTRTAGSRVRDQDLNVVVNALWSAGAEAVAINGMRIGPATFIRTAGSVILINVTPVQSPYRVEAIGDANAMSVALIRGTTGDYLSSAQSLNGISITTAADSSITMEALELRASEYARPIDEEEGH